jgi:hypothetical protein
MVSRRGEFRLVALPGERTRLEGSTWYTLSIFPEQYWTVWGEALLHSIHGRVLAHIKRLSELSTMGLRPIPRPTERVLQTRFTPFVGTRKGFIFKEVDGALTADAGPRSRTALLLR